jgi:hypothetical protein
MHDIRGIVQQISRRTVSRRQGGAVFPSEFVPKGLSMGPAPREVEGNMTRDDARIFAHSEQ